MAALSYGTWSQQCLMQDTAMELTAVTLNAKQKQPVTVKKGAAK